MECAVCEDAGVALMRPVGDLDLAPPPELHHLVAQVLGGGRARIIVTADDLARAAGGDLGLAQANTAVRELGQRTRTEKGRAFHARLDGAHRAFHAA
jgi:hypothetical protein